MRAKVLQLISSTGYYGAENVVIELAKNLPAFGYQPIIGVFYNSRNVNLEIKTEAQKHNIPVQLFPCDGRFDLKLTKSLQGYVKEQQVEIVHSHGYKSNFYALFSGVRTITTCHGWIYSDFINRFYNTLDKIWLRLFNNVVVVSQKLHHEVLRWLLPPSRVRTINNGIDLGRFNRQFDRAAISQKLGINPDYNIVGTVGRLSPEKGHLFLLQAAKKVIDKFPETIFMIVGDGDSRKFLEQKSAELQISRNILLTGPRGDIPELLSLMDLFVLPSLTEGLPMTLLEAMAARRPIIATKVGGVPQLISNNQTGILIESKNSDSLAEAIIKLLSDKNNAAIMAQNAYQIVVEKYSSRTMVKKYIQVYESLPPKAIFQ